ALERIAAREDDVRQRMPESRQTVEEPQPLGGRQLIGVRGRHGLGSAVAAYEPARARRLPVHAARSIRKNEARVAPAARTSATGRGVVASTERMRIFPSADSIARQEHTAGVDMPSALAR